jgi:hypothetical protein
MRVIDFSLEPQPASTQLFIDSFIFLAVCCLSQLWRAATFGPFGQFLVRARRDNVSGLQFAFNDV